MARRRIIPERKQHDARARAGRTDKNQQRLAKRVAHDRRRFVASTSRIIAGLCALGTLLGVATYVALRSEPDSAVTRRSAAETTLSALPADLPRVHFRDITAEAGIDFRHESGAFGEKYLPETMGGGCAMVDYDGDGDQDILFVNSNRWPFDPRGSASLPPTMALYANDGRGHFTNVTHDVGLDVSFYGMGVSVGDYDNDGDPDLFFSALGPNRLFRNDGGTFVDVTDVAGVAGLETAWSTSAGWFDYDNDGWLDLFVCNYVEWSREFDQSQGFELHGIGRAYGPPTAFRGTHCVLYHNEGDGTFRDVSELAGIQVTDPQSGQPAGKALGVTFLDADHDGDLDIAVANDTVPNFLFDNLGDGTFAEVARPSGLAFDRDGRARGSMGIHAAYFRNTDLLGVAIGNFANELSALYVKDAQMPLFMDAAEATGLGPPTRLDLTFGVFFFDYDLDGRLDLFSANGHLEPEINQVFANQHYAQPARLFWHSGVPGGRKEFVPVPPELLGPDFAAPMVGRGAAYGDIDFDGDLDILVTECGGRPRLLRNEQALGHHWLRVQLVGRDCNRDAIGAIIEVHVNRSIQRRMVMPTGSYLSQFERPVTFGLGTATQVDRIVVHWPDGSQQVVNAPRVDQFITITQHEEAIDAVSALD